MEFKDILELNGFSLTSFPTDKFPVIPMDETMRLEEWGEDGYIRLARQDTNKKTNGMCGLTKKASYPILQLKLSGCNIL